LDGDDGAIVCKGDAVGVLLRVQARAGHENRSFHEFETPVTFALEGTGHLRTCRFLADDIRSHGAENGIGLAEEMFFHSISEACGGRAPRGDAAIHPAGFRIRRRLRRAKGLGLRPRGRRLHLLLGVSLERGLLIVNFLLKGLSPLDFFGGRLLAGGKKLFEVAACFIGVLHEAVRKNGVGMADHALGGVREVADVAAIDDEALAIANVGDLWLEVLSTGYRRNKWSEQPAQTKARSEVFMGVPPKMLGAIVPQVCAGIRAKSAQVLP
jgi:hypothetical protein